ncbi:hypothetical protein HanIR_Chr13g0624991 [Helianthus annuus]|nr:hypothetical protein HanIR_Chr13g0624991 [Helianthus annuus]
MIRWGKEPVICSHFLLEGIGPTIRGSLKWRPTRYTDWVARGSCLHLRIRVIIHFHLLREMVLRAQWIVAKKIVNIVGWVELSRGVGGVRVMKTNEIAKSYAMGKNRANGEIVESGESVRAHQE